TAGCGRRARAGRAAARRGPAGEDHASHDPPGTGPVAVAGRIVVVGLGPAGVDLMVAAARSALEEIPNRYTRTLRHPAVDDLAAAGVELRSFDHEYDRAGDVDDVYARIATELLDPSASTGEILYAVPGNPAVAERSVELLREAAARGEVLLQIVPGL